MKRILLGFLVFICFINVNAKDYEIKELIPVDEKASVTTDHFFYRDFYFNSKEVSSLIHQRVIDFDGIKNLDNKERNISITIGFFDETKRNIGLYNFCSVKDGSVNGLLKQSEEKEYDIYINDKLLANKNKVSDIKYIAVMSENPNCNNGTNYDYLGKKIEYIEFEDVQAYDYKYVKYCLSLLVLILVVLVIKFIFDYTINKNGKITDKLYGISRDNRTNEEIKDQYFKRREEENKKNKKVDKKPEIADKSQEKGKTDLHNFYK